MARTLFVGTITRFSDSRGVHVLDLEDGDTHLSVREVHPAEDPTWVVVSPGGTNLYSAGHRSFVGDRPGAPITTWHIDDDGRLGDPEVTQLPFTHASHISFDRSGRWLLVACTLGGGFAVLPIDSEGRLGKPTSAVPHPGAAMVPFGTSEVPGVIPAPGAPMPHAVIADEANRHLIVPDMSLDQLIVYGFEAAEGTVDPVHVVDMPPEARGPRHGEFLHEGSMLLIVNELGSSISTLAYEQKTGTCELLNTVSIDSPAGVVNKPSGVVIDHDRDIAHVANRGRDDITTFSVDRNGGIELVHVAPGHGREPRGIAMSPERDLIVLGHEHSHEVTVHGLGADGLISTLLARTPVQGATSIAFEPGPTLPSHSNESNT